MTQKTKCSKRVRGVSLLLVLAMLASLLMLPASAAETASLEVSGSSIYLSEEGQSFTAKLTVPASQVSGDVQAWAEGLTWTLSRDKSEQDPALYPYCYTGDELKDWQSWGTNGTDGAGYFEVGEPVAVSAGGKVTVRKPATIPAKRTPANTIQRLCGEQRGRQRPGRERRLEPQRVYELHRRL